MRRPTQAQTARWLAHCETQLALPDITDERRQLLEEKAAFYRRALAGRCRRCGRALKDRTATIGPECVKAVAS